DPTYALAHSGLADCYSLMSFYGALPPKDGYARARAAAQRALSIDPTLAEAHASMACVRMHHDWDTAAAERDLRDALALNPRYPTAHQWYAQALTIQGRQEEALGEMRRAQALDPLSFIIGSALAIVLYHARRFVEAELAERAAPSYVSSFWTALVASGRRDEEATLAALERAHEERSDWLPFAGVSPPFDFLREHPRFVRLVEPFRSAAR